MKYALKLKSIFSEKNNVLIHNRYILYFILLLSLANLFYLSIERDFISICSFILIGFLFSFFTKNMLIILFLALTLTNILKFGGSVVSEGFDEKNENTESDVPVESAEKTVETYVEGNKNVKKRKPLKRQRK